MTRETVELLAEAARAWFFEGDRQGLRHREWMALRFLGRANRLSRTPSALASFIGSTRATATQVVRTLEEKSYVVRTPSHEDNRSVTLSVTPQGKKYLGQHDPIGHLQKAVAALGADECTRLRDSLWAILNNLNAADHRLGAGICRDCVFLAEGTAKQRAASEFICRRYRCEISADELGLLCTSFEPAQDRSKINKCPGTRPPGR
jgi:DNA-binding MarR family transcriptional regulator